MVAVPVMVVTVRVPVTVAPPVRAVFRSGPPREGGFGGDRDSRGGPREGGSVVAPVRVASVRVPAMVAVPVMVVTVRVPVTVAPPVRAASGSGPPREGGFGGDPGLPWWPPPKVASVVAPVRVASVRVPAMVAVPVMVVTAPVPVDGGASREGGFRRVP